MIKFTKGFVLLASGLTFCVARSAATKRKRNPVAPAGAPAAAPAPAIAAAGGAKKQKRLQEWMGANG